MQCSIEVEGEMRKKQTISILEAMIIASRDRSTIYRWIKLKKITAFKEKSGHKWIILKRSLKNLVREKKRKGVKKINADQKRA